MALHVKRKFVSGNLDNFIINEKESLLALVNKAKLPDVIHDYLRVSIDGKVIERELWSNTFAHNNNIVFIGLVPQGGGDGKNPLAIIAMIALTVVAGPLANMLVGAVSGAGTAAVAAAAAGSGLAMAASAATAGIMFVGALVINAVFPPSLPSTQTQSDSAGFLGFQGAKNPIRQHGAVRNIFGTYKVAPDMAAEPYVITDGARQIMYLLYDFGYGEVNLSQLKIGSTTIDGFDDTEYEYYTNYTDGPLKHYQNDNVTETFSAEIRDEWVARTAPSPESNEIWFDISFAMGLCHYKKGERRVQTATFLLETKRTSDSDAYWQGASNLIGANTSTKIYWEDIYASNMKFVDLYTFHNTGNERGLGYAVMNSKDEFTVKVSGMDFDTQDENSTGGDNPYPITPGQQFTIDSITYTINTITEGATSTVCTRTGNTYNDYGDSGDWVGTYTCHKETEFIITLDKYTPDNIVVKDEYLPYSRYDVTYNKWISGHEWDTPIKDDTYALRGVATNQFYLTRITQKPFILSMNFKLPSLDEWDIRVKRVGRPLYDYERGANWEYFDRTNLIAIRSVTKRQPLQFKTPHTILEMKIRASDQLSGTVDTLTAMATRVLPYWTGTAPNWSEGMWETKETSNPAWIALEILRGGANPDPIPDDRIDIAKYAEWAAFCETLVEVDDEDAGNPNTPYFEAKYLADCNWDGASTVFERLKMVWSSGRATYASIENKHSVIWESFPVIPEQLFTPKNSWGFKGTRIFTKQPDGLNASFIDPSTDWQKIEDIVYDDDKTELNSHYFENIDFPLCTRQSQSYRDGRYFLAQGKLRPESFTINVDIENLVCQRGSLVEVQHDVARMGGTSSRVIALSGDKLTITLREKILCEGTTCFLRMRFNNNEQNEIEVASYDPVDARKFTLISADSRLNIGDLVVFGEENYVTDQFLVKSIMPGKDLTAKLNLVPVAYEIQNADTGVIPVYTPKISSEGFTYPVPAFGASVDVGVEYLSRQHTLNVTLKWNSLGAGIRYQIWHSEDGQGNYEVVETITNKTEYNLFTNLPTTSKNINTTTDQFIKIIPINIYGNRPKFEDCPAVSFRLFRDTTKPGKPQFFSGNVNADTMHLSWLPPFDEDLNGYILKYSKNLSPDIRWEEAVPSGSRIPWDTNSEKINARIGSYMMKTIDTSGNESEDFALIRTTVPSLRGFDLYHEWDEGGNPLFAGDKDNITVTFWPDGDNNNDFGYNLNGLELNFLNSEMAPLGIYTFNEITDLGDIYNSYISSAIESYARYLNYPDEHTKPLESDQDVSLQIRMSSHNPTMSDWVAPDFPLNLASVDPLTNVDDGSWSGWMPFEAGYFTGRYYQFRAILTSNQENTTPHVENIYIKIDMVERLDAQHDLMWPANPGTALNVYFEYPFKETPSVAITEDNALQGDYFDLSFKNEYYFTIQFYEEGGIPKTIDATFDYVAKGIGTKLDEFSSPIDANTEDDINLMSDAASFNSRIL